ncbi:MAG: type II toxin-antitoxin system RelE/ParE family toxin [Fusobacteriaceae bacterium]|jgi:phage-related protein|nr:type II toxin-antitoxin system RelE/ParE family toxin [Fusobacteriaceae bacterium]
MYDVLFYFDVKGKSTLLNYLDDLTVESLTNKDCRIKLQKILSYINYLKESGLSLRGNRIKHITGNIWELRPLKIRILFFYWKENKFVLLHHFIKDSGKTPLRQIRQAQSEMNDYLRRRPFDEKSRNDL